MGMAQVRSRMPWSRFWSRRPLAKPIGTAIVHIRKEADQETLRRLLDKMREELREHRPGAFLVAEHLAHLMVVQALRLHLTHTASSGVGWLFALADKQIGAAISAMHADPSRAWTLEEIARCVGMSRTTLAVRFKKTVGLSLIDYLTRWRMLLAGDRLSNTEQSISMIASSLGYESESSWCRIQACHGLFAAPIRPLRRRKTYPSAARAL